MSIFSQNSLQAAAGTNPLDPCLSLIGLRGSQNLQATTSVVPVHHQHSSLPVIQRRETVVKSATKTGEV